SFAAGVPVVASAVGGTPEVVDDDVSGYLVAPGDARALASRLRDLLTDAAKRTAMGAAGRRRVEADFTFEAQSGQYQQLFRRFAGARPSRKASSEFSKVR